MTKQFFYRLLTSFFLFIAVYLFFINNFFSIILLLIIFVISYYEFYKLNVLIKKNLKLSYYHFICYNILFLIYFLFFTTIIYKYLNHEDYDKIGILFILFICIFTDVGGILFGKLIGGKKLTKISPHKTIAGSVGGFILPFLCLFFFIKFFQNIELFDLSVLVIITSIFSQIGDLFVSFLKRKAKVKDTGKILPGHGGLLDRIDGILLGLPLGIIIFSYLN